MSTPHKYWQTQALRISQFPSEFWYKSRVMQQSGCVNAREGNMFEFCNIPTLEAALLAVGAPQPQRLAEAMASVGSEGRLTAQKTYSTGLFVREEFILDRDGEVSRGRFGPRLIGPTAAPPRPKSPVVAKLVSPTGETYEFWWEWGGK